MAYRPSKRLGCLVSIGLFAVLGFPLWAVMLLGERPCDTHSGPPCAISWGWMKLINGAVIVAVCLAAGWLVSALVRVARKNDPSDDVR